MSSTGVQHTGSHGIQCEHLCKAYGAVRALDDVSLRVEPGTVLALLGSNGSGKTTTVRVLSTLARPDSGTARVAGIDVATEPSRVRHAIGLTCQGTVIDGFLTGREYLHLIARLRHTPQDRRLIEVDGLLARFRLTDISRARIDTYSGGMRRRLDLASSFIGQPAVLFLDEPSTGLDPHSRQDLWDAIRRRADDGASVLITTQYMEEADALADSIVVLARGRVIAAGPPSELKDRLGGRVVELTIADRDDILRVGSTLADLSIEAVTEASGVRLVLPNAHPPLLDVLQRLDSVGIAVADTIVRRPTLDEVFLQLVEATESSSCNSASHPVVDVC